MRNSIVKGMFVAGLSIFLAMGVSTAFAQHEGHDTHKDMNMDMHKMEGMSKQVTMVGEVLDMYCYMKHPADGQGAGHMKCAQNCIRKGLPIGFLSDGKVYLIIGKEHESAKDMVVDYAGMQSQLTGTLIDHDGVMAIEIEKIEKAPAKSGS